MKVLTEGQSVWVNMEVAIPYSDDSKLTPVECRVIKDLGDKAELIYDMACREIVVNRDRIFDSYNKAAKDCAI